MNCNKQNKHFNNEPCEQLSTIGNHAAIVYCPKCGEDLLMQVSSGDKNWKLVHLCICGYMITEKDSDQLRIDPCKFYIENGKFKTIKKK